MKKLKKKKKEEGQAIVEFAFVLPIFLLLVMGILDFGFLFYNYISMENAARNASRVACVAYEKVAYDTSESVVQPILVRELHLPAEDAQLMASYDETTYTEEEKDICIKVAESLQKTGIDKSDITVTVQYTYDNSEQVITEGNWKRSDRYKGDVIVTVKGKANVLTPVLGITADHMQKQLTSSSTFKVEQQYSETSN